jgi:hypothetical protein
MRKFRVALLALATLASTAVMSTSVSAEDRRVKIINGTDHTMLRFYASNSSRTDWEEDILGSDMLRPGQSVRINIDDGTGACIFDFKAVFDDGDTLTRSQINVCKVGEYRYTE